MKVTVSQEELAGILGQLNGQPATEAAEHGSPVQPLQGQKPCPFCAEMIQAAAIRCRHCGADLVRGRTSGSLVVSLIFFAVVTAVSFARSAILWAAFANTPGKLALLLWNSLLSFGMVGILIGAWRRTTWGRDWISGTSTMQALALGYAVLVNFEKSAENGTTWVMALLGIGCLAAIVARVAIHTAKADFVQAGDELRSKSYEMVVTVVLFAVAGVVDLLTK